MDSSLTELGELQASRLGQALSQVRFDLIYSSPSYRTVRTAEIIRGDREIPILTDARLREIGMGSWEGRLASDIREEWPEEYHAYWNIPALYRATNGGETFHEVAERVVAFLHELLSNNEGKTILIVTHTVTLKFIMGYFESRPLERICEPPFIHPTSLSQIAIQNGAWSIKKYGDMSHMSW